MVLFDGISFRLFFYYYFISYFYYFALNLKENRSHGYRIRVGTINNRNKTLTFTRLMDVQHAILCFVV